MARDICIQALADRLSSTLGIQVYRDYHEPGDQRYIQPCCCLVADRLTPEQRPGLPPIWDTQVAALVYHQFGTEPCRTTVLLAYLDGVEAALKLQPGERPADRSGQTTLGGTCIRAQVDGTVIVTEGAPEALGVLNVPITIRSTP